MLDCSDCGQDTLDEYYMVWADVWLEAVVRSRPRPAPHLLCVGCLEARLGRRLGPDDFTAAPVNTMPAERSERLLSRLLGRPERSGR